jgi:hypothetical protein
MRELSLILLLTAFCHAQDPLLWGNLHPSPHLVGFRSAMVLDSSRKYADKARPILFDVWCPAANVQSAALLYERYLQVPDVAIHPLFKNRLEGYVRGVVVDDLFHKTEERLDAAERAAWNTLLATPTVAHLDAPPLSGPFPMILYHSGAGGSFEDNSLLFEYLASFGYVVVSSAFQSPFPKFVSNNIGGVDRSGPDLDFLAGQAHNWPYADSTKLGSIGHSAGAQNILQWIGSPRCPASAVVSLDTTLEYPDGYRLNKLIRAALLKLTPPRIPVLLFAQARLNPQFTAFEGYLENAPHYEAQATELSHDGFVTHGYLGSVLMHRPKAELLRRSYEEVYRTIQAFLDASLKDDPQAASSLRHPAPLSPVSINYQPAR